jgi:hypothetical protein
MPTLRNPRWERFARLRAEGKSAAEAYKLAGYAEDRRNAHRLTTFDAVDSRTEELMMETKKRHRITVDSLCDELDIAVEQALKNDQPNVLVSAAALKARIGGLDIKRMEVGGVGDFADCGDADAVIAKAVQQTDDPHGILAMLDRLREALIERLSDRALDIEQQQLTLTHDQRSAETK